MPACRFVSDTNENNKNVLFDVDFYISRKANIGKQRKNNYITG